MSFEIIADENIEDDLIKTLREVGYSILSIKESYRGIKDIEIIHLANQRKCLILTEDKDFGEWVFSHGMISVGIVFLRYSVSEKQIIIRTLQKILEENGLNLLQKFTVITPTKIRIRDI